MYLEKIKKINHVVEEDDNVSYLNNVLHMDMPTGLYNRNVWELLCSKDRGEEFTVIVIDIDNLKQINDEKGHVVGDEAIQIVAKAILKNIRQGDTAIRYGGDEFIIIVGKCSAIVVENIIYRIHQSIRDKSLDKDYILEISVGYSKDVSEGNLTERFIAADKAMYMDKRARYRSKDKVKEADIIATLRNMLEELITEEKGELHNNKELLNISEKLDKLVVSFYRNQEK